MRRALCSLAAFSAFLCACAAARAQDDQQLARGQKYLEKLAASWTDKLPVDRFANFYLGRKCLGKAHFRVQAPEAGRKAAFELVLRIELGVPGQELEMVSRAWTNERLGLIAAESETHQPGLPPIKRTLLTADARWKIQTLTSEKKRMAEGLMKAGMGWDFSMLALFGVPDESDAALIELGGERPEALLFQRVQDKVQRSYGGPDAATPGFRVLREGGVNQFWHVGENGRTVEMVSSDSPVRALVVEETTLGKDLEGPPGQADAIRAIIELMKASRKADRDALKAAIDFEKYGEVTVEGWAELDAANRADVRGKFEELVLGKLLDQGKTLPDEKTIENVMAATLDCEEGGDSVLVFFPSAKGKFRLYQAADGKWKVFGIP